MDEEVAEYRQFVRVDDVDAGQARQFLDEVERGFSFRADGPLDMRMNGTEGETAADVVNRMAERELADLIYTYGEERASRRIARAIVELRDKEPFERTEQLAAVIRSVVRRAKDDIDPATRTFQALRIYVNEEPLELDRGLAAAERLLATGGRLAVVSFHSLEDRRVKTFLQRASGMGPRPSRHMPMVDSATKPTFRLIERRAVKPGSEEVKANPRARSARLRFAERTAAPVQEAA